MGLFWSRESEYFNGHHEVEDSPEGPDETDNTAGQNDDDKAFIRQNEVKESLEEQPEVKDPHVEHHENHGTCTNQPEAQVLRKDNRSPADNKTHNSKRSSEPECPKLLNSHRDMIPLSQFTRDDLPEPYNKIDDVYNLTMAMAELTVQLKVGCVSKERPDCISGTSQPYPMHKKVGVKENPSFGTGRICDIVERLGTKCTCEDCEDSDNPSKDSWEVKIFTATHVVFDDMEAKKTKCILFKDGDKKQGKKPLLTLLSRFKNKWAHAEGDLCFLSTITCKKDVCKYLFQKIKEFNIYWKSLKGMQVGKKNKEKLVIIVSHPHGGKKHVSVGFGLDVGNFRCSKYIYTAPTCPGSSGAPVYVLGNDWFGFVHTGSLDSTSKFPKKIYEIFPSDEENSIVKQISFSSYYFHDTSSKETETRDDTEDTNSIVTKCRYNNYSARWYYF